MKNTEIKRISPKMLEDATKEFKDWFGVQVPYCHMVKFAETVSYDDMCYFDTSTRERLADFIAEKVVGSPWPYGSIPEKQRKAFYATLKKNGKRFGLKFDESYDE